MAMPPSSAMTQLLKNTAKGGLRLLLTPVRLWRRRTIPTPPQQQRMEIANHILLSAVRDAIREGHTATINVKGYSMRPFLEHLRDKVLLASPSGASVGDAVLAEIAPGFFVLHRIIDVQPHPTDLTQDAITLMGDGNVSGTEHCTRANLCGTVVEYIYPHRTVPATNEKLVRRIRLWRRLLPIRRLLLAVYRACC